MFCPEKNSYLQLVCAMEPRVINKAVRHALRRKVADPHDELPPAQRLESMQPSMFAPCVDISRANLGFGRIGLRIINREINSEDSMTKLRAIHTLYDQVMISENAMFLISLNVVYRLIDLMEDRDPIVREKVIMTLTRLANYYQGRNRIMSRPIAIDRLIFIILRDRKEIRYVAALCLKTLSREKCACEVIIKNEKVVENLLRVIKNDHMGIVLFHINTLKNLAEWDPVKPLKANAFQVMRKLLVFHQYRIVQAAMDCLTQLCKHSIGQKLADEHDLTKLILSYLVSPDIEVIVSAVGLMAYTTVTPRAKWRVKEFAFELIKRLVSLSSSHNIPVLQLRVMQVLINLCDCPDMRIEIQKNWQKNIIKGIKIRSNEQWDGTSPSTTYGLETGHNYRTMCIEEVETIKTDYGDSAEAVNVRSYLLKLEEMKKKLIKSMNKKPFKN